MEKRIAPIFFLSAVALMAASCTKFLNIRVAPGSTADNLVFNFSSRVGGGGGVTDVRIKVLACDVARRAPGGSTSDPDDYAVWIAAAPAGLPPAPTDRLAYGKEEYWLKTALGPKPLSRPGCYVMHGYGKDEYGRTRVISTSFKVAPDGAVRQP